MGFSARVVLSKGGPRVWGRHRDGVSESWFPMRSTVFSLEGRELSIPGFTCLQQCLLAPHLVQSTGDNKGSSTMSYGAEVGWGSRSLFPLPPSGCLSPRLPPSLLLLPWSSSAFCPFCHLLPPSAPFFFFNSHYFLFCLLVSPPPHSFPSPSMFLSLRSFSLPSLTLQTLTLPSMNF